MSYVIEVICEIYKDWEKKNYGMVYGYIQNSLEVQ